jgi:1-acyl-sn-glycerol-3-phosphate acyltransferase
VETEPLGYSSGLTFVARFATGTLKLLGWRVVGTLPDVPKVITIVYPHTSNWDFPLGLLCGMATGAFARWHYGFMIKDSYLRGPLGPFMRWLGGIPIDRGAATGVVSQTVTRLNTYDRFMLVVTPEGTRKKTRYWKSGFYRIACETGLPIMPIAFDYGRRVLKVGDAYMPTGNAEADLDVFREFFAGATAKHPEHAADIGFKPSRKG